MAWSDREVLADRQRFTPSTSIQTRLLCLHNGDTVVHAPLDGVYYDPIYLVE